MQTNRLRQIETSDNIENARRDDVRITATYIENVERLPVAVDPGADVEEPWRRVVALVDVAFSGPRRVRQGP
jgi:hypothetical protein